MRPEDVVTPVSRDQAVETVRQRTDIVELVGRYVKLKKTGSNFVGLCPFHAEKTPSFTVSPRKGFFHCFGCSASGDVFSFLMKMEGKTFGEALEDLATRAGVQLPERSVGEIRAKELTTRLLAVNEEAAAFYEQNLWGQDGGRGREVLAQRQVSTDAAKRFHLGYAPPGWHNLAEHLRQKGASIEDALTLGLLASGNRGPYDLFRQRLVFPILGLDGKVRGFGARQMDPEDQGPKYINSRQSPVYDKSEILFGLAQARPAIQGNDTVVVVEGYFDVLTPVAHGVEGLVATCGTALSAGHARLLRRICGRVVTIYDADAAGLKGSFRAAEILLAEGLSPNMVSLPEGDDPDSFVRAQGGEALRTLLASSRPAIEMLAEAGLREAGTDIERRTQAMRSLVPLLAACRDSLSLGNYLHLVSERFAIDEVHLRQAVAEQRRGHAAEMPKPKEATPQQALVAAAPEEETVLALLLRFPQLVRQVRESRVWESFSSEPVRLLVERLLATDPFPSAAAFLSQLNDADLVARLSVKIMDDPAFPEDKAGESMGDTLRRIRAKKLGTEIVQLQARIQEAGRSGRTEEARTLEAEKLRLAKERAALGVAVRLGS